MCRKVGVEKSQHPRSSICSLYPGGEVARVIADSCARRWGYYIQRNKEAAFLCKAGSKGKVWLIWVGTLSAEEQSSGSRHSVGESYGGHLLLMLLTFSLVCEDSFAVPPSLTGGRSGHSHGAEALGALTWLCPCQQHTFTHNFTHSYNNLKLIKINFIIPVLSPWI